MTLEELAQQIIEAIPEVIEVEGKEEIVDIGEKVIKCASADVCIPVIVGSKTYNIHFEAYDEEDSKLEVYVAVIVDDTGNNVLPKSFYKEIGETIRRALDFEWV